MTTNKLNLMIIIEFISFVLLIAVYLTININKLETFKWDSIFGRNEMNAEDNSIKDGFLASSIEYSLDK